MDPSTSLVIVLIVIVVVGILTSWIKPVQSLPGEDEERSRIG